MTTKQEERQKPIWLIEWEARNVAEYNKFCQKYQDVSKRFHDLENEDNDPAWMENLKLFLDAVDFLQEAVINRDDPIFGNRLENLGQTLGDIMEILHSSSWDEGPTETHNLFVDWINSQMGS